MSDDIDPGLQDALDALCDELGMGRLADVLAEPEDYAYSRGSGREGTP